MKRLTLSILFTLCLTLTSHAQTDSLSWQPSAWQQNRLWGYGPWGMHEGVNVNLDFAAFASFGKHQSGGGFGQRLSATYVKLLDERLWTAIGAGISNTTFRGNSYRSGGVYAALGYRFDEHWEAVVYGHLNVANNYDRLSPMPYRNGLPYYYGAYGMPFGPYGYGLGYDDANRIGAAVTYHFSPSFSLSVSVEKGWYGNSHDFPLPDRHENPPYVP